MKAYAPPWKQDAPLRGEPETKDPSPTVLDSRVVRVVHSSKHLIVQPQARDSDRVHYDRPGRVGPRRRVSVLEIHIRARQCARRRCKWLGGRLLTRLRIALVGHYPQVAGSSV